MPHPNSVSLALPLTVQAYVIQLSEYCNLMVMRESRFKSRRQVLGCLDKRQEIPDRFGRKGKQLHNLCEKLRDKLVKLRKEL